MDVQFRQGDVLIVRIEQIPKGTKKLDHGIVMEGEGTGHMHQIDVQRATLRESLEGKFLDVLSPVEIIHPEHAPIEIPAGFYKIVRQREYEPQKASRWVED